MKETVGLRKGHFVGLTFRARNWRMGLLSSLDGIVVSVAWSREGSGKQGEAVGGEGGRFHDAKNTPLLT